MFINQILAKIKSLVYLKSETDSLLNGKASSSHTHTKSEITDFPTIPSKTSQLTNDSGFITSEIDSMGEGWVRFKCGLQICWGQTSCSTNTANMTHIGINADAYWGSRSVNFGSAFKADTSPYCTLAVIDTKGGVFGQDIMAISNAHVEIEIYGPIWDGSLDVQYIAIGRWK